MILLPTNLSRTLPRLLGLECRWVGVVFDYQLQSKKIIERGNPMGWQADSNPRPGEVPGRGERRPASLAGFGHGGGWAAATPSACGASSRRRAGASSRTSPRTITSGSAGSGAHRLISPEPPIARVADELGFEAQVPVGRWRGVGEHERRP